MFQLNIQTGSHLHIYIAYKKDDIYIQGRQSACTRTIRIIIYMHEMISCKHIIFSMYYIWWSSNFLLFSKDFIWCLI